MIHALKTSEIAILTLKTCARCGAEFRAPGRQYACDSCRKPDRTSQEARARRADAPLSQRERQIVELIAESRSNKNIAYLLGLTEGTIKEYLNRVFRKVGVGNRTELACRHLREQVADLTARLAKYEGNGTAA